jgi:hypothetical protein
MDRRAEHGREKALRFAEFCRLRFVLRESDDRTAEELGFGSREALYLQLEDDGSPVCGKCGLAYPDADHHEEHRRKRPEVESEPKLRLPPARDATALFGAALEELNEYPALIDSEEGWVKGRLFATYMVDRDSPELLRGEEYSRERWQALAERFGFDSEDEEAWVPIGSAGVGRVGRAPSGWLIALIGAYALAGQPLAPLVERLHPRPEDADAEELHAKAEDLLEAADHLATLVRGGRLGKGNRPKDTPDRDVFAAWIVRGIEESEGPLDDDDLRNRLRKYFSDADEWLTANKLHRLRHAGLESPE